MKLIFYHVIIPLTVTLVGIFTYHFFVTVPVLQTLENIQNEARVVAGEVPETTDVPTPTMSPTEESNFDTQESISLQTIPGSGLEFSIPHYLVVNGQQEEVNIAASILRVRRFVPEGHLARQRVDVPICTGAVCGGEAQSFTTYRAQALIAIDIELTNNNRVGSVAIDPTKQMRISQEGDFFVPKLTGENTDYMEVLELSTTKRTLIVYVPADESEFNLIYGADLDNPTGLFRINFENEIIEALVG